MTNSKEIRQELDKLGSLRDLVEIYGEIASIRMKKIRDSVLKSRDFLSSINDILQELLVSYGHKVKDLLKSKQYVKGGRITFLAHNGKIVQVLISANTGFYGDVIQKTIQEFLAEVRKTDGEVTIIGKLGLSLFQDLEPGRPYTYFDYPDFGENQALLGQIIRHLVQYEEIHVFYGKYLSVVTQVPTVANIAAGAVVEEDLNKIYTRYIFEPSIEEILVFFEEEIFTSLFEQSLRESQLAKFASRILAMDKAGENIRTRLRQKKLEKLRIDHGILNKKQINSMPALIYKSN